MSISVKNLTKIYGQQKAVDNISFEIKKGEIVGFLGPNGAGKSTTMKMITGFLPPTKGDIEVSGIDVKKDQLAVRKKVGYLPEANPLYFEMYVREYLQFSAGIHQLGKSTSQRVEEMIDRTGLSKEAHKRIGMLSKGYKQRVSLAQAMLHDPEVLILDEPTSGLDPNQIVEIRDLITTIGQEKTVLLSTHIMQEVQAMCSRVIIISNGRLVTDGSLSDLKASQKDNALQITFAHSVEEKELAGISGVNSIEKLDNNSYRIHATEHESVRKEIMKWVVEKDINLVSLQMENQTLEEVFRDATKHVES